MAGERLVDSVVDHLEHHVMQAGAVIGVADIHAGPETHGVQAFQHLDGAGIVGFLSQVRWIGHGLTSRHRRAAASDDVDGKSTGRAGRKAGRPSHVGAGQPGLRDRVEIELVEQIAPRLLGHRDGRRRRRAAGSAASGRGRRALRASARQMLIRSAFCWPVEPSFAGTPLAASWTTRSLRCGPGGGAGLGIAPGGPPSGKLGQALLGSPGRKARSKASPRPCRRGRWPGAETGRDRREGRGQRALTVWRLAAAIATADAAARVSKASSQAGSARPARSRRPRSLAWPWHSW